MQERIQSPELLCSIPTSDAFSKVDFSGYDGAYLGQPYCLKVQGNLIIDIAGLKDAVDSLHQNGKRAFLATSVVPNGPDMPKLRKAIEAAVGVDIDGVEVHDMGLFRMLRSEFPDVTVHTGHFANVYNPETARTLFDLGVARVSPSYELTLEEKNRFLLASDDAVEFEVPVSGKMPVGMAHSCLLCLTFPERSEVACEQQCAERRELEFTGGDWRMRSAGTAMLMAEDLVMIEHMGRLAAEGYKSFRLETSIETPQKISALGLEYRAAMNDALAGRAFNPERLSNVNELAEAGTCNGWYFGGAGRDYMAEAEIMLERGAAG